jgi:hypothetical protein
VRARRCALVRTIGRDRFTTPKVQPHRVRWQSGQRRRMASAGSILATAISYLTSLELNMSTSLQNGSAYRPASALDLEAVALEALEKARALPHGPERTEALKKAGVLQNAANGKAFHSRNAEDPPKPRHWYHWVRRLSDTSDTGKYLRSGHWNSEVSSPETSPPCPPHPPSAAGNFRDRVAVL